jgi:hypothetical protein
MDVQGIELDPIAFFDSEIKKFIERCMEEGELIVLGIDANTDVRQGDFVALLESLGLIQVFKSKFGTAIPQRTRKVPSLSTASSFPHRCPLSVQDFFRFFAITVSFGWICLTLTYLVLHFKSYLIRSQND